MIFLVPYCQHLESKDHIFQKDDELKLEDEIRFYYMKQDELIGCEVESIAYREQVEFTIQDEDYQ